MVPLMDHDSNYLGLLTLIQTMLKDNKPSKARTIMKGHAIHQQSFAKTCMHAHCQRITCGVATMGSCFSLVRPHRHGVASFKVSKELVDTAIH